MSELKGKLLYRKIQFEMFQYRLGTHALKESLDSDIRFIEPVTWNVILSIQNE